MPDRLTDEQIAEWGTDIAVVEDIWPTIRTYVYGVFDKGFARGRAVEVEQRKAEHHG
ncbi:hypothetical protein [Antrihabitans spumae]|uniref:Uncharacterized protein n=1 Tax=Antrihabitans spumae TaxID=3373370 RepID=A0ABW7K9Z9_9NOCA